MRVGLHIPVSGGLVRAARHARSLGCECMQLFARNPRGWGSRQYPGGELAAFRAIVSKADIAPLVVHSCYLANLASADRGLRERSLRSVSDDMVRAAVLGGDAVVCHFGYHRGAGVAAGLRAVAAAVRSLLREAPDGVSFLLENSPGRGSELGAEWSDFARVLDLLQGEERVGVCFDTCHAHGAGHRLNSPSGVGRTLREFDRAVGLSRLRLLHLNDAKAPAGSHVDQHQHIGRGMIGERGFRALVRRRDLQHLCAIVETPRERRGDDRRNLTRVRQLLGGR